MSFLEEDDAYETLQVALAFIDACEGDDSSSSSSSSSNSSSSLSAYPRSSRNTSHKSSFTSESETIGHGTKLDSSSIQQQQKQQDLDFEAARRERAMKSHMEAVKRSRAKKRSEEAFLREQAAQLEEKLKQLQLARRIENSSLQVYLQRVRSGKSGAQTTGGSGRSAKEREQDLLVAMVPPRASVSLWQELAAVQARERLQSQALNAELKAAVSKQVKVVESLQTMLLNTNGNQGDFVRDQQQQQHQQFLYTNALLNQGLGIMADLKHRAHREFLEMDAIFRHSSWTEIADSLMFSSQSKFTPEGGGGPVMELRMNVPLHCNFRDAVDVVWRRATTTSVLIDTPSYSLKIQHLTKTSYQKNYTTRIEGPNNSIIKLEGIAHVQRFMGVDHDAYIWSCAMFLCSDKSEVFREKGWVVASNCPAAGGNSDSATATLCRGFSQVSCDGPGYEDKTEGNGEGHEVGTNWSSDARFRRTFILKSLAHHTRGYHESTQNLLLSKFSGHQMH